MVIRIEGDEQDFVERNEDEGRTVVGSPSLLAQPAAEPQEQKASSPLATGNARPLPYLDEHGNDIEPGNVYTGPDNRLRYDTGVWAGFSEEPKEPFTERFNSPHDTLENERFTVPATPEETAVLRDQKERAVQYGTGAVVEDIFAGNRIAWEIAPDKMAHNLWLHRETDIPLSMMGDSDILHEAEIRAQMKADAQLLWDAPENVVQWFNHPTRLAMARDDMAVLTAIGKAFDRMAERIGHPTVEYQDRTWDITQGYRIGRAQTELGALYTKQMNHGLTPAEMRRVAELQNIVALNTTLNPGWWERMLTGAGRMTGQRQDQIMRGLKWGSIAALATIAAIATGGVGLLGSGAAIGGSGALGTGLTASTLVGSSFAGGMAYGAMESGFQSETGLAWEEFSNMRDENGNPMDPNTARWAATIYGSLASLIEMAQLDAIAKPFMAGWRSLAKQGTMQVLKNKTLTSALTEFAKSYLGDLVFEVGTETLQQGAQIAAREGAKRYENAQRGRQFQSATGGEILGELGETAVDSFFEFALSMLPGPLFRLGVDVRASRQAQRNLQIFQSINDETAASKLKGREPEMFRSFVSGVTRDGPVQNIGIPVERFVEYFQSQDINPAAVAAELGISDQLSEAMETGSDLLIPTETFTEKIAGSEHYEGLKEDLRFGETAKTAREAREFSQNLVRDFDHALREASETEAEYRANREAVDRIREDLKAQIIALNHKALGPKQAEMTAALYTAFVVNEARLKNISPRELADRINLRVEYDKTTGEPVLRRTMKNAAQEWYGQPLGPDVDLEARVNVIPVTRTLPNIPTWLRKKKFPAEVREQVMKDFSGGIANRHTGMTLTLSSLGLDHILNTARNDIGTGGDVLYHAIPQLTSLVREAYRIEQQQDLKPPARTRQDTSGKLEAVHRFAVPVMLDGKQHILILTAKEYEPGKAVIDGAKLYDMKHVKEMPGRPSQSGSAFAGGGIDDTSGSLPQGDPVDLTGATGPSATPGDLSVREMVEGVKDAYGENYLQSATVQLPQTPEEFRQVAERAKNTPSSQWTQEDFARVRAFDEQFDPTDMDTWGLSPEERAKLEHIQPFDEYDYETWPDAVKRERAAHLNAVLRNTDEDPAPGTPEAAIFNRMAELEALSDEESSAATDTEHEKLEKQRDKIQNAARKEFDALEREMERLSEKRFAAREELGTLLSDRLRMQIENYPDYILEDFRHPANKDIASILNMLREAEALPAEQWSPELRERMADFIASERESEYWGRNPYDRAQFMAASALDFAIPSTWANYEETADQGRRAMDLEERIAATLDPQEKKALRSELAALKKEVKPLLKEAEAWREDVIVIDEGRIAAILEKAKGLETYYQGQRQQAEQDANQRVARGYSRFPDGETVIGIFKNGDRSTFLHEMGHLFLEQRRQLALQEDAPDIVRQDWAKITDWLGVSNIDFSKPLSKEDRIRWTNAQEKWASGFEKYLMDGEAPTPELQRAFRNFKKWLTDIYEAVRNIVYTDIDGRQHEFEINDEIRGVMDRMLASEEEIEASQALREARNIANALKERGIPDDVSARYKDLIEKGADRTKAKLYRKLISELRDEKRAELQQLKKDARRRAGQEVWDRPEYRALKALRISPEKGGLRLSMPDLVEQMGVSEAEALVKELPFGVVANVGVSIDTAADLLGYPSGDALIDDLKKAKETPPAKAVADRVRMEVEQLGSLIGDPEALRREVEEALHGDERLEWIALEEQLLREEAEKVGKSIGEEEQKERRERTRREQSEANEQAKQEAKRDWREWANDMAARAAAYAETAKKILAGKTLSEATRTGFYMAAERRAADNAYRAAMDGKSWMAAEWKQREMLNHALAAESLRIKEEREVGERLLKKYWPNRKKLRGVIGEEHFAQIMGLLERAGYNQADPRSANRPRLADWIKKIGAEKEIDLPIAQWIQDLDVRDTRTSPRSMSVEEFRDVVDAVKMIDHVGRRENRLLADARNADFAATIAELEAATLQKHGAPKPQSIDPNQEGTGLFGRTLGTLDRAETLLRMADGFEDQGKWWDTFYRPAQRAFVAELEKSKKAKSDIEALFKRHFPDKKAFAKFLNEKFDTGQIDPGTGKKLYWTGENLLAAMLNWGNEHNRERLVFGNGFDRNVFNNAEGRYADDGTYFAAYENGRRTVESIFSRLAKDEHWDFVQDVWDWLDDFWPEIEKLEREMTGVAPEKVESSPVRTSSGKILRGGYYPVRFDSNLDWRSLLNDEAENAKALYETQSRRASTRHGHTKERVERVIGRPLKLSLNVVQEHAGNVIHDLTHRPVVRDLTKLVQNDRVRELLTHAVGKEGFKQFNPWIQGMAAPTRPVDAADQFMSKIMGNAAAVQLGLKVIPVIGQIVGHVPAAWKLGPVGSAKAIANTVSFRWLWGKEYRDFAFNLSPELKDRINGTDRDIRAALDLARSDLKGRALSGAKAALYLAMGWADMAVSLPVWTAAYDQGLNKFNGDQQKAVDHADYIVRTTQNTGAAKDLAQIQRGSVFKRAITSMYYSAFGSQYQMFKEEMTRAGKGGIPDKVRLAAFCLMMFIVQSMLEDWVKGRTPWSDDEEPDIEDIMKWQLQGSLGTFAAMFPVVRDIASASMGGYGGYRPSPAFEGGSAIARAAKNVAGDVWDLAWDTKDLEDLEVGKTLKSVFDAGGYAFGLPTTQLARWGRTFMRWVNAETDFSPWELIWAKRGK